MKVSNHYVLQQLEQSAEEKWKYEPIGGEVHTVGGVYREVAFPEKLVFTWAWEEGGGCGDSGNEQPVETLVKVEFREKGQSTEVLLTHELFPTTESRDKHDEGWSGCLTRLAKVV